MTERHWRSAGRFRFHFPQRRPATHAAHGREHLRRIVRVSSHFPFWRTNHRLRFDRDAAHGYHLDIPAGTVRWAPGETREVELVRFGGTGGF